MADTIPAMLEQDEYVLNKNAVKAIGKENLDTINFEVAPRNGYQHGGPVSILSSLLSRTQKKDKGPIYPKPEYTIPAGKNIFGQSTEEMGMDELMEMIMPTPPVGKISKTVRQLGKKGIDEYMIKPTRHEGIKKMGELVTTGKGKKEVLENANLETLLMEVKKWARSRGIFEDVIKKQEGGSVGEEARETLLSMLSGGKYETSKDLPSIREQAIPALEFMTGAEHVPEGEEASLLNLALAVPFLGKFGKGAKPALSKYYASLFGSGEMSNRKIANYLKKMFDVKGSTRSWDTEAKDVLRGKIKSLEQQSPSLRKMSATPYERWREGTGEYMSTRGLERGRWDINEEPFKEGLEGLLREAKDAHKYYYGKQHGGIIEDHSLMEYMMPTLDKRLGKPLMKFEHGGTVPAPGQPGYYHYLEELGQSGQTQAPAPGTGSTQSASTWTMSTGSKPTVAGSIGVQNQLGQSPSSMSTSVLDIFKEAGLEIPDADYLSGIEAYDPTKQKRLQQDLSMKMPTLGGTGAGGFAGPTGAQQAQASKQRELGMQKYQQGAGDLRKEYREDLLAQIAEDMSSGAYGFEEREDPYMG